MLTRRKGLALGAGAGFESFRFPSAWSQTAPTVHTSVAFDVPPGACDCHVHVISGSTSFPFWPGRAYTPPPATVADLLRLQADLHLHCMVIVQPSVYGIDNRAMLGAIHEIGSARARSVAVIDEAPSQLELDGMHAAGVRGIRSNLDTADVTDPVAAPRILQGAVQRIEGRGWHIQIYVSSAIIGSLQPRMAEIRVPLVFDHFTGINGMLGIDQPGFMSMLSLMKTGKAFVKPSAPYRACKRGAPRYPTLAPLVRELVRANAEEIVWESDWPHPGGSIPPSRKPTDIWPPYQTDDRNNLSLLANWLPKTSARRQILIDNPARLYDFDL